MVPRRDWEGIESCNENEGLCVADAWHGRYDWLGVRASAAGRQIRRPAEGRGCRKDEGEDQ